ncbi:MAG: deoxyhypusine synthase family protein [Candidatus Heimdallarchaeota archaeon]|nr:deoxyhypusine synthase family protein [Candidatus Heimdallarchaeota archaeon]
MPERTAKKKKLKKVKHAEIWKDMTVKELLQEYKKVGFNGKELAKARDVMLAMLADTKCIKFATIAGALVPGGLKKVIYSLVEHDFVDALIVTGSILTHDLIEAFGDAHFHAPLKIPDYELQKQELNRIYNVVVPTKGYRDLEDGLQAIFPELPQEEMSASRFIYELGKKMPVNCLAKMAAEKNIPIYCPSLPDSILGFQVWMFSNLHALKVNPALDQQDLLDFTWKSDDDDTRVGALIIAGGVPKHFLALAAQIAGKALDYAVQITMDRPEHGGVSGASISEAISWGKVDAHAKTANVIADATIALPLLIASLL